MKENSSNPLNDFQEFLGQQHQNAVKGINRALFDDIVNTAKNIEENKGVINLKEVVDELRERFKNEDLNQVTDIFIYSQCFLSSNEEPLPRTSQLCINIGKLFDESNLNYIIEKIYTDGEVESGSALSFLGYLALYDNHTSYVLNFIKENFEGFSRNKKTECVFQLKEIFPDNPIVQQIIEESGIKEYTLVFSTGVEGTSTPVTYKMNNVPVNIGDSLESNDADNSNQDKEINEHKPKQSWWKFW